MKRDNEYYPAVLLGALALGVCTIDSAQAQTAAQPPQAAPETSSTPDPAAPAETQAARRAKTPEAATPAEPQTTPSAAEVQNPARPASSTPGGEAATQPSTLPIPNEAVKQGFREVFPIQGGLTAEQAARQAATTSVDAEIEQQNINAAGARIDRTMWQNVPRVTLSARYARLSRVKNTLSTGSGSLVGTNAPPGLIPPGTPLVAVDTSAFSFPVLLNSYQLQAGVVVPLSDYLFSTTASIRGAEAYKASSVIDQKTARVRAAAEAKLAYYNWARSKLQTVVAKQSLQQAQERLRHTQRLFAAGRVAHADVLQAEAFAADAELVVQKAQTGSVVSEQQLRVAMHLPDSASLEVGEDVFAEMGETGEKDAADVLYREGLSKRLEIKALDKTAYAMTQGEQVQDAGAYPRVEAFANGYYANPNPRVFPQRNQWRGTWDVGVQATWTLTDMGTASANSSETAAKRAQVVSQKRKIEDALRIEILSAQQAMKEARLSAKTAVQAEKAADAAYEARDRLFQHGRATHLEVIQAETSQFQARLNLIDAYIALRIAKVKLEHALGRDTAIAEASAPAAN